MSGEDFYDLDGRFHLMSDSSYLRGSSNETPKEKAEREKKRAELTQKHKDQYWRDLARRNGANI